MGEFICFLIGPNGAGKTTVGRMLADFLSITFVDLDTEVQNLSGKKLLEIIKDNDLELINQIEDQILNDLANKKNFILSIGVNSIRNLENKLFLNKLLLDKKDSPNINNKIVYLAANPTNQYIRSMLSSKPSPILLMIDNKLQYLTELTKKMEPIYNSIADFVVNTDNCLVEEVVNKIIDYLYCSAYS